jgi:hypothetical protein
MGNRRRRLSGPDLSEDPTVHTASENPAPASALPSIGVHPRVLQPATFPPFDLYVRAPQDGAFSMFRRAHEPVYANTWERLERRGVELLYVRGEDQDACLDYVEQNLAAVLAGDALPPEQAAEWTYRLACRAMSRLLTEPDSPALFDKVDGTVGALVGLLHRHPWAVWHLADCAPLTYTTATHCVNVCAQLVSLARKGLEVSDPGVLRQIGIGGALHDLGKVMVPTQILAKPGALTRREFAQVKKHPVNGLKMARPFLQRSAIAESVIAQHHENAAGGGYPDGRSGESINTFARAARIVDVFDALTTHRPYAAAMDNYAALKTMVNEMRGHFDVNILRRFIRHFNADGRAEAPVRAEVARTASPAQEPPAPQRAAIVSGPVIRPEPPVPSPQTAVPAPPEPEPLEVVIEATAQDRVEAIRELTEVSVRDAGLMAGIMGALKRTVAGLPTARARRDEVAPSAPGQAVGTGAAAPAQAPSRSARQTEVEFARQLFPLVWQLDLWRERFLEIQQQSPEGARARAEALGCVRSLREDLERLLTAHHVEIVAEADAYDPVLHSPLADGAVPDETASPRVKRAGFVYRGGPTPEVLEPARVVFITDLAKVRRAG